LKKKRKAIIFPNNCAQEKGERKNPLEEKGTRSGKKKRGKEGKKVISRGREKKKKEKPVQISLAARKEERQIKGKREKAVV